MALRKQVGGEKASFWGWKGLTITEDLINSSKQADRTSALRPQINYPSYDKKLFY